MPGFEKKLRDQDGALLGEDQGKKPTVDKHIPDVPVVASEVASPRAGDRGEAGGWAVEMVADIAKAAVEQFVVGDRARASAVDDYERGSEEDGADSYRHPLGRRESRCGQGEAKAEQNGRAT